MKVRVFDAKSIEPAAAFEPQETPILGSRETGLVVQLGAAPGEIAYGDVAALAAFRSLEKGSDLGYLLFFLAGRPRPLVAEAGHIRFDEFPIQVTASGSENVRQVAIHLCRQADSLLVDRGTLAFMKSGGALPLLESGMAMLATAFGRQLMPQASAAFSPHRTRPLSPLGQAAPPPDPSPPAARPSVPPPPVPPPSAPRVPSVAVGPAPISTQRRPAVQPGSTPPPVSRIPAAEPPPAPQAPAWPSAPPPPAAFSPAVSPPPAPPTAPPAPRPAPSVPSRQAFGPMEVQVFDPAIDVGDPMCQPLEVSRAGGSPRGLEVSPESVGRVAFEDVRGLAVFRSSETGAEKTFLLLVCLGPRPLLVEAGRVAFEDFPIRISTAPPEDLRQLALYLCQKAGRMVMDRSTGTFLQRGGPAPVFAGRILALATAFRRVLPPPAPGGEPGPPAPAAAAPWGFSAGAPLEAFLPPFTEEPAERSSAASAGAMEEAFRPPAGPGRPPPAAAAPEAPYSVWSSLAYPMRGLGAVVLVGLVVYYAVAGVAGADNPFGAVAMLLNFAGLYFVPSIMFGIVRSTARGENTLEELPKFFDFGPRFGDLFTYILLCLIPAVVVVGGVFLAMAASLVPELRQPVVLAAILGAFLLCSLLFFGIWAVGLGATAVYQDIAFTIRVDLHLRALLKCWKSVAAMFAWFVLLLLGGALASSVALAVLAPDLDLTSPSPGLAATLPAAVLGPYYLLEGSHLVGLLFRRQKEELASIYLYR